MPLSTENYGFIIDPFFSFMDDKGKTIKNGFLRVFIAGSSTPAVTYLNWNGAMNQETIQLDNSGRCYTRVIGAKDTLYKVCVYDSHHSQETPIITVDNVQVLGVIAGILNESVTTEKLADEAVTTAKIHESAVTTTKLANNSVTIEKLDENLNLVALKDFVTPEMFGAVGDGETDDTQALQDAFDSGHPVYLGQNKTYITTGNTVTTSRIVGRGLSSRIKAKENTQDHVLLVNTRYVTLENFCVHGSGEAVASGNYGQCTGIKTDPSLVGLYWSKLFIVCCDKAIHFTQTNWASTFSELTVYYCNLGLKADDAMLCCKFDSCRFTHNVKQLELIRGTFVLFLNCGFGSTTTRQMAEFTSTHHVRFLCCNFEECYLESDSGAFKFNNVDVVVLFDGCYIRKIEKLSNDKTNTAIFWTNTGLSYNNVFITKSRFAQNVVDFHVYEYNIDRSLQFHFDWESFQRMTSGENLSCNMTNFNDILFHIVDVPKLRLLPDPAVFSNQKFKGFRCFVGNGELYEYDGAAFNIVPTVPDCGFVGDYVLSCSNNKLSWIGNPAVYNPLGLQEFVVRLETTEAVTQADFPKGTLTEIDGNNNIYEIYYPQADWTELFTGNTKIKKILGANTSKVTKLYKTFFQCTSLQSVALFDTSKVTTFYACFYGCLVLDNVPKFLMNVAINAYAMFYHCRALTALPDLYYYVLENCDSMFDGCTAVADGESMTNAYNRLSSLESVTTHTNTFSTCGANTVEGAAALAQIPASWGGTAT